jgi:hypothetical protein
MIVSRGDGSTMRQPFFFNLWHFQTRIIAKTDYGKNVYMIKVQFKHNKYLRVAIKIEGKIKNEAMENCLSLPHTGAL